MAATSTAFASAVLGVAPYVVANEIKNIQAIKSYGKGRVVSCCVLEDSTDPCAVGCTRRCTLSLPGYEEKLLRECLTNVTEVRCGSSLEMCVPGSSSSIGGKAGPVLLRRDGGDREEEVKGIYKTVVELTYLPCGPSEAHRCVFSSDTSAAVASCVTVLTVAEVSNAANRSYLAAETTVTFTHPASVAGIDDHARLQRRTVEREAHAFWHQYNEALVSSIEAAVLAREYPVLSSTVDRELRQAYERAEEAFCEWSASSGATLPKQAVLDTVEAALLAWSCVLREYQHEKLSAETLKGDVAGTRRIAAEAARQLAERTATAEDLQQQLAGLQDTDNQHKELEATTATAAAANTRQPAESQQKAQQLPVDKRNRGGENSTQPGAADKLGGANGAAHLSPSSTARGARFVAVSAASLRRPSAGQATISRKPAPFNKHMLSKLFGPDGALDDNQANEIFRALLSYPPGSSSPVAFADGDAKRRGECVTAEGVRALLLAMDHVGLYEDVDGTQEQLRDWRATMQRTYAERYGTRQDRWGEADMGKASPGVSAATAAALPAAADENESNGQESHAATTSSPPMPEAGGQPDALTRLVERHDLRKEELKRRAMTKLADDTVARFAFREGGRLYFDEFCLALMHLFK